MIDDKDDNGVSDEESETLAHMPLPRGAPNPYRHVFAYIRWLESQIEELKKQVSVRH